MSISALPGAGALDAMVARASAKAGIAGLEFLRSIPGTVGGFARMNGGAYGREVADILISADVLLRSGERVTLPLAMPGVMTGAIISMAHALGETAPLLLIGMVSFVPGVPHAIDQPVGALPSLIYIWENASERAFHERTAAAIIVLLVFMIIASKGAAGVTGAGMATLAAGLQAHRPELLGGMGVIVGIDKFMSEARALTNFTGNAVATLLIGRWVGELDGERARRVLSGELKFDEATVAGHDGAAHDPQQSPTIAEQAYEGHPDSSLNFTMAADGDRNPAR